MGPIKSPDYQLTIDLTEPETSNTDSEGDPSEAWISEEEEQDNGDEGESEVGKTAQHVGLQDMINE